MSANVCLLPQTQEITCHLLVEPLTALRGVCFAVTSNSCGFWGLGVPYVPKTKGKSPSYGRNKMLPVGFTNSSWGENLHVTQVTRLTELLMICGMLLSF